MMTLTGPNSMNETTRNGLDAAAGLTVIGTWVHWLPEIAAALAIFWTLIRIYEWARIRIFKYEPTKGIDP